MTRTLDETKLVLAYDGEVSYGKSVVKVTLEPQLHNWIMQLTGGVKQRRAEAIRGILRSVRDGVGITTIERRFKRPDDIKAELSRKKKQKKMTAEDRRMETYLDIQSELKGLLAKRRID